MRNRFRKQRQRNHLSFPSITHQEKKEKLLDHCILGSRRYIIWKQEVDRIKSAVHI
jgi:hypothetical protein